MAAVGVAAMKHTGVKRGGVELDVKWDLIEGDWGSVRWRREGEGRGDVEDDCELWCRCQWRMGCWTAGYVERRRKKERTRV